MWGKLKLVVFAFLLSLLLQAHSVPQSMFLQYLPHRAEIMEFGHERNKAIFQEDVDGDGGEEVVIFYRIVGEENRPSSIGILILQREEDKFTKEWEFKIEEASDIAFVYHEDGSLKVKPVSDVNGDGKTDIVFPYDFIGTVGGSLKIFNWNGHAYKEVDADWEDKDFWDQIEFSDLDGDGTWEIIFHHLTSAHQAMYGLSNIYKWDGESYKRANEMFPHFYDEEIERVLHLIHSYTSAPASWWEQWCSLAGQGYIYQRRFGRAISLYEECLGILDDGRKTGPNVILTGNETEEQQERIKLAFERERAEAKSRIHMLMGDAYKKTGDRQRALAEYQAALRLDPGNAEAQKQIKELEDETK